MLLYCGSIMLILAMAMSLATVSQAQQQVGQPGVPLDPSKPVKKVPESSTYVLLMIGIGLTGIAYYGLQRRKRRA